MGQNNLPNTRQSEVERSARFPRTVASVRTAVGVSVQGSALGAVRESQHRAALPRLRTPRDALGDAANAKREMQRVKPSRGAFGSQRGQGGSEEAHLAEPWLINFREAPWHVAGWHRGGEGGTE